MPAQSKTVADVECMADGRLRVRYKNGTCKIVDCDGASDAIVSLSMTGQKLIATRANGTTLTLTIPCCGTGTPPPTTPPPTTPPPTGCVPVQIISA